MGRFLTHPWGSRSRLRISGQLRRARAAVPGVSGAERVGTHCRVTPASEGAGKVQSLVMGSLSSPSEAISVAPHPVHKQDASFTG